MPNLDLATLRRLLAEATPGPWRWWTSCSYRRLSSDATGRDGDVLHGAAQSDGVVDIVGSEADRDLIVALVNAAPALLDLAEVGALLAEVERRWPDGIVLLGGDCGLAQTVTVRQAHHVWEGTGPTLVAALRELLGNGGPRVVVLETAGVDL